MADYIKQCMESLQENKEVDASVEDFEEIWCSRCMNENCKRSGWDSSSWTERMERQERALKEPEYANPEHFESCHKQDFISYGQESEEGGVHSTPNSGWESWGSEDTKVHKEDPPTKEKSSEKVEESVKMLEGGQSENEESVDEEREKEEEEIEEDLKDIEVEEVGEKGDNEEEESEEEMQELPDQSGKIIGKDSQEDGKENSELLKKGEKDKWEVEEDKDGNITVNISKGEKGR